MNLTSLPSLPRSMFAYRVEERLSLRVIVLALGWWVALSLGWVGTPLWIWVGGSALLSAGHAFSWLFRSLKTPLRSAVMAVSVVGSLVLVPRTVSLAATGDLLPVAHFLLLFQAITSFELRTRGGLYTSIGISGAIFFLVSQRSLDASFGVFMIGFATLLLSFLALSYLVDQTQHAEVRWFRNRLSIGWFWSGALLVSLLASTAIFLVLPKHFGDPIGNARGAVLPMRASEAMDLPEVEVEDELAPMASVLPSIPSSDVPKANPAGSQAETVQDGPAAPGEDAALDAGAVSEDVTEPESGEATASELSETVQGAARPWGRETDARLEDSVVMQVRSPVLTYWRGQTFDTFDGETWHSDPASWRPYTSETGGAAFGAPNLDYARGKPLYSQTYFLRQAAPPNAVFTGYTVLDAGASLSGDGAPHLLGGSVYRVVSAIPDLSSKALSGTNPTTRLEDRYHQFPQSLQDVRELARRITKGADSDLERAQRIVTYLDRNYAFDDAAADQLALTAPPSEFLARRSAGTSMDFASATVLLARAAGVPSRLVTGYLPGRFDPLTGTYVVRSSDEHAWAEVFLGGAGWVPFDGSPRPAAASLGEGGSHHSAPLRGLFNAGFGNEVHGFFRASPQVVTKLVTGVLKKGVATLAGLTSGVGLLVVGVFLARRMWPMWRSRGQPPLYARLVGDGRAEKLLRRAGLAARGPSQTLGEYMAQAEPRLGDVKGDLAWIRNAAWVAAYDPSPYDRGLPAQARQRMQRLKAARQRPLLQSES